MATPLGDFVRGRRDATLPVDVGLADTGRRRAPGLRRADLAALAGMSVEYLTRIEQGRDRNPSPAIVRAIGDALRLGDGERMHLTYLAKITAGKCDVHVAAAPPRREADGSARALLAMLEPELAYVTNRVGDVLAATPRCAGMFADIGIATSRLPGDDTPNVIAFVFSDPRAPSVLPERDAIADELAFGLWTAPTAEASEWLLSALEPAARDEMVTRMHAHEIPLYGPLVVEHPSAGRLAFDRHRFEVAQSAQQVVVLTPAGDGTRDWTTTLQVEQASGAMHATVGQ